MNLQQPAVPFVTAANARHLDLPWGKHAFLSWDDVTKPEQLLLVRVSGMPVGEAHNFHYHPGREELIYVVKGSVTQWVGTEKRVLNPGEMAFIPAGLPHTTINTGDGPAEFLAILGPVSNGSETFTVDCFDEEPWRSLTPAVPHPAL